MFNFKDLAVVYPNYGYCDNQEVLEELMLHGMIEIWERPDVSMKMAKSLFAKTPFGYLLNLLPYSFYGY